MKLLINEQFWRKLFIILNSLLLVFSIVLIALGSDTIYNLRKYNTILHVPPPEIIPTVIFTGCLGTIACLLGFTGLFKPKHSSFLLYIIALTVTTVIEMSSAIASTITTDQFEINARISLMESIKSFNVNVNYMEEFNRLQQHFECCGALSYLDYSRQVSDLPSTCKVKTLVYAQGCVQAIIEYIHPYIVTIITFCLIFGFIKIVYLLLSMLMFRKSIKGKDPYTLECCTKRKAPQEVVVSPQYSTENGNVNIL
ncbi:25 kDa integral membrane protein [Schistosoma japonicum]|nr:25 kDa integral membrane protein [Schistosoma japonicum]KAH8849293.1 25 kDa integral membrane protein [Schistosoma japonicum]